MSHINSGYVLITGGAGFIGINIARSYLLLGQPVNVFDNLSRPGSEDNVVQLQNDFPGRVLFTRADVRNRSEVDRAVANATVIYHLAAQVAVTSSLEDPLDDLGTNLMGTLHLLEAVRSLRDRPPVLFTSTNKVYGHLSRVALVRLRKRYEPEEEQIAGSGAGEDQALEFLSPYGCSKGSADQYVLDYARSYGVPATVFRMSCIYGPYQRGSEDQGWVAPFLRQALKGEPITIYGDGMQVRDLLFVQDLIDAMRLAVNNIGVTAGEAFNVGGGVANSTSLIELIDQIGGLTGSQVCVDWGPERLGDQKWYVADTSKARTMLGWNPQVTIEDGLHRLCDWYLKHPALIAQSEVQVA